MKKNIVWVMFGGVIILFFLNFSMIFFVQGENKRGTFGDQFGAVNALFSGLAFTGLIYTIILQRRDLEIQRHDLKLQREEIALNRKEMEEQTAEFEKQNETLRIQRFENTFFNMLSQFQEVVNSLSAQYSWRGEENEVKGRESFKAAFEKVMVYVEIPSGDRPYKRYRGMADTIENEGLEGYCKADVPTYFDHYFRLFYRILKFVKDTPLITEFDDEYEYTSMLRAILSRYELVWLYYNGLSDYGNEKLKPLIERYAMLKNLREDLLVDGVDVGSYAESAYRKTRPDVSKWNGGTGTCFTNNRSQQ
jgi:hypothetical protein